MQDEIELLQSLIDDFGEFKSAKNVDIEQLKEAVQELKAKGGRNGIGSFFGELTTKQVIAESLKDNFKNIASLAEQSKKSYDYRTKTVGNMTASANLTGNVQASYAGQPATRGRAKTHFRDIVPVIPSATGTWKFYRQNSPVGEGSFDFQTTHGAAKNQLDYDVTENTITVDYLAGYARIARQMLQDLPWMQNFLVNELQEDYLRTEDYKFFGSLYSAATGSPGTSTVTAEKIIETIANLEDNDYDVNAVVVTNQVWAKLLKTKPADYSVPGGITVTPSGGIAIAGVPIVKVPPRLIGNNMMLIGDFTKAAIIQAEALSMSFSEHDGDNFTKNLVTARVEARVNLAILRPDSFVYTTAGLT